jgi:hypothetical protein
MGVAASGVTATHGRGLRVRDHVRYGVARGERERGGMKWDGEVKT